MNRRKTIKNLMLGSVGFVSLPAWANGWSIDEIDFPLLYSNEEQEILSAVVDTIIPQGNAIGSLSIGVDKYLQRLLADCYESRIRENVRIQLNSLNESAVSTYNKTYNSCTPFERQSLLLLRENSDEMAQKEFFDLIKNETVRGFRTSKEVMTKYYDYMVAPGFYHGCVDLNMV